MMNGKTTEKHKADYLCCHQKRTKRSIWLIYVCLYIAGAIAFRILIHLSGKTLVQIYDAKDQYLPFLRYLNLYYREFIHNLLHGEFHIKMFDYSLGFGLDPIRVLSYYGIADPLSLPVVFFKQANVLQYFQFIVQFKPFLAGAAFIGMCFHFRKVNYMVPFCALFYLCSGWALSAFSVHPFFINFIILLPMAIAGIDNILYGKSPVLFIITIFLAGCVGFYFLFMVSVCMLIFAIVRLVCRRKEILKTRKGDVQKIAAGTAKMVAKSLGYYMIGLAMSCFILLPALLGVMDSFRGTSANLPENMLVYPIKTLVNLYSRAVMLSPSCNSLSFSMIGLFCITAVLAKRRKKETGILTLIGIVLWFSPAWSVFMSGITVPNYRWFFALSLLVMYLCTDIGEYLAEASPVQKIVFIIAGAAAIAASFSDYDRGGNFSALRILAAVCGAVFLIASCRPCKRSVHRIICIVLICMQCLVNTAVYFSPLWFGKVNEYTSRDVENIIDQSPYRIVYKDPAYDDVYRTELGYRKTFNTSSVLQIPSVHIYASIIPESVSSYVVETENNTMSTPFSIYGLDRRPALMQMCSVRYFVVPPEDNEDIPCGYEEGFKSGETKICCNKYALTPGFVYYKTYDPEEMGQRNGIEKQSLMLQGAVVESSDIPEVLTESVKTGVTKINYDLEKLHGVRMEGDSLILEEGAKEHWMDITANIPGNSEIYARLKGFSGEGKLAFRFVREDEIEKTLLGRDRYWAYGQENFSSLIDRTEDGSGRETHYRVYLSGAKKCRLQALEFYAYDLKYYEKTAAELAENCVQDVHFEKNSIIERVDLQEQGLLCVPVPYSKGWTVYVDGEQQDCLRANYLCTAVSVPAGEHEVTFRYVTPGIIPGAAASAVGVIAFVIVLIGRHRKKK